jgi:hypothetical protein
MGRRQSVRIFQYKIFSQLRHFSTKYSVSKGYSSTKYSVNKDILVQNIQPIRISSINTFQSIKIFEYKYIQPIRISSINTFQSIRIFQYKIFS